MSRALSFSLFFHQEQSGRQRRASDQAPVMTVANRAGGCRREYRDSRRHREPTRGMTFMANCSSSSERHERCCALCHRSILDGEKAARHHPKLRSEGGIETVEVHAACHTTYHSARNHFREWGRNGGLATAARGWWIFNLKRGLLPPDPLKWIPFGYG